MLICLEFDRPSLQAAWAYLLICSVGIALALLGTFLLCGEARTAASGGDPFLWTHLSELAPRMRAAPVRLAFLFLLVGYGTKAGLAPMHTWLPAAHSQAPSPVSAVLSGVLLNCAIYCISRFVPIVEGTSVDAGWSLGLLVPFGLVSIGVAAAFIVGEHDIKRLLAFHSVEHMGIIALGIGVGGGAAALFHTLNHSVCKMLTFFCAGTLAQRFGTRDMRQMRGILGSAPAAGAGIVLGILALVGLPPFSIFMSELWIVKVGIAGGRYWTIAVFLAGAGVVFIAAIRHAIEMVWKRPGEGREPVAPARIAWPLVVLPLAALRDPRGVDAARHAARARERGHRHPGAAMTRPAPGSGVFALADLERLSPQAFHDRVIARCRAGSRIGALLVVGPREPCASAPR